MLFIKELIAYFLTDSYKMDNPRKGNLCEYDNGKWKPNHPECATLLEHVKMYYGVYYKSKMKSKKKSKKITIYNSL